MKQTHDITDISSTIPSSYSVKLSFCKSGIKRMVEIFT